jgi:hypothetical protein
MKQYAVMHIEKGASSASGLGGHIDRTEEKAHTFRHADPEKRKLNIDVPLPGDRHKMPLNKAIEDRIKKGYCGKTAIRKDAVKHLSIVLSGSHEQMTEIFRNKEKRAGWLQSNCDWAAKEFGVENIVKMTLHCDEKTPHFHLVVVPLTKDGRLSAKSVMGNPEAMSLRQSRYAAAMQPFGLSRGVEGSPIKHTNEKWYHGQIQKAATLDLNFIDEKILLPKSKIYQVNDKPGVFDSWKNWREGQNKAILDSFAEVVGVIEEKKIKPLKSAVNALQQNQQTHFDKSLKYNREIAKLQEMQKAVDRKLNPEKYPDQNKGFRR